MDCGEAETYICCEWREQLSKRTLLCAANFIGPQQFKLRLIWLKYMNGALTGTQWCNVCTDLLHISESDIKLSCSSYNRQLFMSWKTSGVTGDPVGGKWPLSSFGWFISRERSRDASCVCSVLIDTRAHTPTHTKSVVKICFWFNWLGREFVCNVLWSRS